MNTDTDLSDDLWNIYELVQKCIPSVTMRVQINKYYRSKSIVEYIGYMLISVRVKKIMILILALLIMKFILMIKC